MTRSMTAYGRAAKSGSQGRMIAEIHSVNRRGLDLTVNLPKELFPIDIEIRKQVTQWIERGQVTIRISIFSESIEANRSRQLKGLKKSWESLAEQVGYPVEVIAFPFLVSQWERGEREEEIDPAVHHEIEKLLIDAWHQMLEMKLAEGKALALDMSNRLKEVEQELKGIEKRGAEYVARYRHRLTERIRECVMTKETDERILREIALYADKVDITEELTRLHSHIDQFRKTLASEEKSVGRRLDFLMQEMQREANTISAKAPDSAVVAVKSTLEKIREQVQNIE